MNREDYLTFHKNMCEQMILTTQKKNSDYANSEDPFANFRSCEKLNIASVMQGFMVRMLDKLARINSFAQKGVLEVKDESVFDSLLDLANCSILMAGFIKAESEEDEVVWGSTLGNKNDRIQNMGPSEPSSQSSK